MSYRAGGAGAWRHGTSAAEAPHCAGYAVLLRRHGRSAGAPRSGDATKASACAADSVALDLATFVRRQPA